MAKKVHRTKKMDAILQTMQQATAVAASSPVPTPLVQTTPAPGTTTPAARPPGRFSSIYLNEQDQRKSAWRTRSEEHTSELQSQSNLVCRLLLEKKKKTSHNMRHREMS